MRRAATPTGTTGTTGITLAATLAVTFGATLAGCAGRATGQPPAQIDVTCTTTGPAATCAFTNTGATAGTRCVTVLAGRRGAPTIVRSVPVCSGKLAPGAETVREVALAAGLECPAGGGSDGSAGREAGGPLLECLARTADAGQEDAAHGALGDELAAPPVGPVTDAECRAVADHIFDLSFAEATSRRTEEERAAIERDVAAERGRQIEAYRETCRARVTRAQLTCAMAATDAAEVRRCDEVR